MNAFIFSKHNKDKEAPVSTEGTMHGVFAVPADACFAKIWRKIPTEIRTAFFSTIVIGILCHIFMIANSYPNHDSIYAVGSLAWTTSSGRWLLGLISLISSDFILPWVNGFLAIVYLALSSCIIVSCYQIKSKVHCVLISGAMSTFPSVFITLGYMDVVDAFFLSVFFACLSAFITVRYKYGFIAGIILITFSLAIYQAYLGFAIGLSIGMLILDILNQHTTHNQIIIKSIKLAATVIVGTLAYLFITRTFFELSTYRGINNMGVLPISRLPWLYLASITGAYEFFFNDTLIIHQYPFSKYLYAIIFIICGVLTLYVIVQRKIYSRNFDLIYLLLLIFLFQIGVNIIRFTYPGTPNLIMVFCFVLQLVFMLAILETATGISSKYRVLTGAAYWAVLIAFTITIFGYTLTANQWYLRSHYLHQQGYSFSVALISKIESVEGFTPSQDILFVGLPSVAPSTIPEFDNLPHTGMPPIPRMYSYNNYLKLNHGFTPEIKNVSSLMRNDPFTSEIIEMPVYPIQGSIRLIGDNIVVKFDDVHVLD